MNGLVFHDKLLDQLLDRSCIDHGYLSYVENALGTSLNNTILSTSEHTAPFNTAATISFLFPQLMLNAKEASRRQSVYVLAASLIPLDNADYPRGFILPSYGSGGERLNLFPSRLRKASPALLPQVKGSSPPVQRLLAVFPNLAEFFSHNGDNTSYAEQISACMEQIASQWFTLPAGVNIHIRPLEEVARDIVLKLLCDNDVNLLRILFDERTRGVIFRGLKHVYCAWGDRRGSFLFWSAKNHRVFAVMESNGCLRNDWYSIPLTRDDIYHALSVRAIMPTVFLSFLVLSYLPGLPIAGGPRQLHYYDAMIRVLNDALDIKRGGSLSAFGYNAVDLSALRLSENADDVLHPYGTGLALFNRDLDPHWISSELARCTVMASIEDRYE